MLCSMWRVKIELLPFGESASSQISALQQLLADLSRKHQDRTSEPTHAAATVMCFVGRTGTTVTQDIYKTSVPQRQEWFQSGTWRLRQITRIHSQENKWRVIKAPRNVSCHISLRDFSSLPLKGIFLLQKKNQNSLNTWFFPFLATSLNVLMRFDTPHDVNLSPLVIFNFNSNQRNQCHIGWSFTLLLPATATLVVVWSLRIRCPSAAGCESRSGELADSSNLFGLKKNNNKKNL